MGIESLTTGINYILKKQYSNPETMAWLAYRNRPLLAAMPKVFGIGGSSYEVPVTTSLGAGISNTFSSAQTNASLSTGKVFAVTMAKMYAVQQIDTQLLMAARKDNQTFMKLATDKMDLLITTVAERMHSQLYGSGTGSIGQRASISTNTITLSSQSDVHNFYIGLVLVASATDGGALRTGSAIVTAVDRSAGTVTVDNAAGITSFANNDFLYIQGTAANGGANIAVSGLRAWVPTSSPSAAAFFGVDRTADVASLAGSRFNGTSFDIFTALVRGLNEVAVYGGAPEYVFMSFPDFSNLQLVASDKLRLVKADLGVAKMGFEGVEVAYAAGKVIVLPDAKCPRGLAYALKPDTWELACTNGDFPHVFTEAGDAALTVPTADAIELRSNNYCQLVCKAPIHNGVIQLPTT